MEFEGWDLWLLGILGSTLTDMANELKVVFLGFCL
jgi:hypothetical protein